MNTSEVFFCSSHNLTFNCNPVDFAQEAKIRRCGAELELCCVSLPIFDDSIALWRHHMVLGFVQVQTNEDTLSSDLRVRRKGVVLSLTAHPVAVRRSWAKVGLVEREVRDSTYQEALYSLFATSWTHLLISSGLPA